MATIDNDKKKFVSFWVLCLILLAGIFILRMDVAPYLDEDEFLILDLGRIIINPDSDWSITWMIERNEPAYVFFYIGPVMNELLYLFFGEFGPRIGGITGALVAATVLLAWLISRKTPPYVAFSLGLIFLLDPIFVQSYTLGRLDGWAIAIALTACWLLRNTTNQIAIGKAKSYYKKIIVLAGFLAVIALFTWPSAFFLFPLIIAELIFLNRELKKAGKNNENRQYLNLLIFGGGCLAGTILLLLLIAPYFYNSIANMTEGLMVNIFRTSPTANPGMALSITPILELLRGLKFTPVLFLLSIISVFFRRDPLLLCGALAAVLVMCFSVVYVHRILYLLPYMIAMISIVFSTDSVVQKRLKSYGISFLFIWAICISLVARSILVFHNTAERERSLLAEAAKEMIGTGSHKVYLSAPEFYLTGRSFGWKMFRRYAAIGDPLTPESIQPVLANLDYVILRKWEVTQEFDVLLSEEGFSGAQWHSLYKEPKPEFDGRTTNINRLRNLFSIFEQPYGPYKLYKRQD